MNFHSLIYGADDAKSGDPESLNPGGVRLFFSILGGHWLRLAGMSIVFTITCLPIITIPCSMTAMSRVLGLTVQRKMCYPLHDYFRTFASEWKRSTICGLPFIGVVGVLVFAVAFYAHSSFLGAAVLAGISLAVLAFGCSMMTIIFPMIAFTDLRSKDIVRNAALLTVARLPQSLAMFVISSAVLVLIYLFLPYTSVILPVYGFSFIGFINTWSSWNALARYVVDDGRHE